jgi:hypothetical protein
MQFIVQESFWKNVEKHPICHPVAIETKTVGSWVDFAAVWSHHAIVG